MDVSALLTATCVATDFEEVDVALPVVSRDANSTERVLSVIIFAASPGASLPFSASSFARTFAREAGAEIGTEDFSASSPGATSLAELAKTVPVSLVLDDFPLEFICASSNCQPARKLAVPCTADDRTL